MNVLIPTRPRTSQPQTITRLARTVSRPVHRVEVRNWTISLGLLCLGFCVLPLDTRIAAFIAQHRQWEGWKIVLLSEMFAHAWGVGLIALGIASLTPWNSPRIPRLFCASLGAGLLANLGKLLLARTRPHSFDLTQSSWESFQGWFPWFTGAYEKSGGASLLQSFPSAHSATAAGLAVGLIWLYPQGKCFFVLLCSLAFMQRLVVDAHFLSDVCWGGALGVLWASYVCGSMKMSRRFTLLEKWLAIRWKISAKIA